jgi:hypothetical protein
MSYTQCHNFTDEELLIYARNLYHTTKLEPRISECLNELITRFDFLLTAYNDMLTKTSVNHLI